MTDGLGPATAEDVHLSAQVTLTTADGKELARIEIEQLLRGVLLATDPEGIDGRLAMHFVGSIITPLRARVAEYAKQLQLRQPANEFFGRIDAFFPERSRIAWYDPAPRPMSAENARRVAQAIMDRESDLLELE